MKSIRKENIFKICDSKRGWLTVALLKSKNAVDKVLKSYLHWEKRNFLDCTICKSRV